MWRHDPGRTGASEHELPEKLQVLWQRQFPAREPVWEDVLNRDLMPYDTVLEPVIAGKRLFLAFNDSDKVAAFDTETGAELWSFYADGPVRLPPVAWDDMVFFSSDDGHLYCLAAADGSLKWRFRGAPAHRLLLGNRRLISMWPGRGGPVVADGVVYFAASIWPFMGTFIHALDARSGRKIWVNDGTGSDYMQQPHNGADAFGGVGPQGALVISGDRLLVPGGRSVPACFNLQTGELLYYRLRENGKRGGSFVCTAGGYFFAHTRERNMQAFEVGKGDCIDLVSGRQPVLGKDAIFFSGPSVTAVPLSELSRGLDVKQCKAYQKEAAAKEAAGLELSAAEKELATRMAAKAASADLEAPMRTLWQLDVDASGDLIQAGRRLYAAGNGRISAIQPPAGADAAPAVVWEFQAPGHFERLAAADNKLFAVSTEGTLYCFGAATGAAVTTAAGEPAAPVQETPVSELTDRLLAATGELRAGHCLVLGLNNGEMLASLAAKTGLAIIGIDADSAKIAALRRRFDAAGLYGRRIHLLAENPATAPLPPYMAELVVSEDWSRAGFVSPANLAAGAHRVLRPYSGKLVFHGLDEAAKTGLAAAFAQITKFEPATAVSANGGLLVVQRGGPLPGAASWTHEYGDVGNTIKSDDRLVRPPLGLLWFGNNSNEDTLPRHGHGPTPQIIGGRLFIQGMNSLSARDVYTGRVLWRRDFEDLGTFGVYYDDTYQYAPTSTEYNQKHIPGANARGSNFVAAADLVYIIQGAACHALNAADGSVARIIELPEIDGVKPRHWGYIGVAGDLLIAGADFVAYSPTLPEPKEGDPRESLKRAVYDRTASRAIVVMNRHTGAVLWQAKAAAGFLHNGIAAGHGLLFCLDRAPAHIVSLQKRRGRQAPQAPVLKAFDINTGRLAWQTDNNIFGTWLGVAKHRKIVVHGSRPSRDMLEGEGGKRIQAFNADTGDILWSTEFRYNNPLIIHNDSVITDSNMISLGTGEPLRRVDPLTGQETSWALKRTYGCGSMVASEHLLTFRSGAAGFFDLSGDGGTGNLGGFKAGCSSNLLVADGVLNAPDYTRTCSCAYQNQTSLALIHMPELEFWTNYPRPDMSTSRIGRLGVNFGAPGNRRATDGTFWIEHPAAAGVSPQLTVSLSPESVRWFRGHALNIGDASGGPAWVAASGAVGVEKITVTVAPPESNPAGYLVRLHFAEPEEVRPGDRVFSVRLQGQEVDAGLDVMQASGGRWRSLIREFRGITIGAELEILLTAKTALPPVISGVELLLEKTVLQARYHDAEVAFSPQRLHIRPGEDFVLQDIRRLSGAAADGRLRYRPQGAGDFISLPFAAAAAGGGRVAVPGSATAAPFEYFLEIGQGAELVRVPPHGTLFSLKPDCEPPESVPDFRTLASESYGNTLVWQSTSDDVFLAGYRLWREIADSANPAPAPALLAELGPDKLTHVDSDVVSGQRLTYTIIALDGVGRESQASKITLTVPENRPPVNRLTAKASGGLAEAFVGWDGACEPDVTEIVVYRAELPDGPSELATSIADLAKRSWIDPKVAPGKEYSYSLSLRDRGGLESERSAAATAILMPAPDIYLSDLEFSLARAGWEEVHKDTNSIKKPIRLRGREFAKGLGAHAPSVVAYQVQPGWERLVALAGVDDFNAENPLASVAVQILADGNPIHKSPVLRPKDPPWQVNVAIPAGTKELRLVFTDAGDGMRGDLSVWAGAGIILAK